MKPLRFRLLDNTLDGAEAALAGYLPGLDVQLVEFANGTALLPPDLLEALQRKYGAGDAVAMLRSAGLSESEPVTWRQVIEWGVENADVWLQPGGTALAGTAVDQLDWHLAMCGVDLAWEAVGGCDQIDWKDISVGHIDTGYTEHPVFGVVGNSSIDVGRARTFMPDDPKGAGHDPLSGLCGGHGTGSASIVNGFSSAERYFGVAPRVPLVPARISDCVVIDPRAEEFEAATRYLIDKAKVRVINVSMGTFLKFKAPEPIRRALEYSYQRGVILIGAAGNVPARRWRAYPAALPQAIAVAGVNSNAEPSSMSSYGPWVDFSGPARGVRRACTTEGPSYGYREDSYGTTMATAMTSGAAALWLLKHASAIKRRYREPWQRIEAFRLMARRTASAPPAWLPDRGFGAGILHVGRLMDAAALPKADELQPV